MRKATVLAALLAAAVAVPATAQTITVNAGIDLWETNDNGSAYIDFSDNQIPAGTFCDDSAAFNGQIPVKGSKLNSTPDLGTTDTIIKRLNSANAVVGGPAVEVDIVIQALSLVGANKFDACGVQWTVDAFTNPHQQTTSKLWIKATSSSGGTFSADLDVNGTVRFVSSKGTITLTDKLNLKTTDANWAANPRNGVKVSGPVKVDTDADGIQDLDLPGTANFHPGWRGNTKVPVPHSGPHPTLPPSPCPPTVPSAFSDNTDTKAVAVPVPVPIGCVKPVIVQEVEPVRVIIATEF